MTRLTVALAGNPNSGKTTLFNRLTGARQKVGNYPGVTVEWKEGSYRFAGGELRLVDLPGTYSLTTLSDEELVARDYLLQKRPDVVVDVVDASNLERNLYLTTDLIELGLPVVVVLNMSDVARRQGRAIDTAALAERLGVPVVPAVGTTGEGVPDLVAAVQAVGAVRNGQRPRRLELGPEVEERLGRLEVLLAGAVGDDLQAPPRWLALKLLEKDERVMALIADPQLRERAGAIAAELDRDEDLTSDVVLAQRRYAAIGELCRATVRDEARRHDDRSERIDQIAMHPVWGLPVFLVTMFVVFNLTFTLGNPLMSLMEIGLGWLSRAVASLWSPGAASPLKSLLVDGIIGGVGGVLVFLPNIVLLFLAIALLEGSGYMARAAFVMDRFMSRVGLHGKSFIPLLIGFGCTVPAIMATRTLETRRDRLITMMVLPLMSCGARLPIYALIIPAFFPRAWQGPVLWVIYLTGILLALVGVKFLRGTMFRGETTPFLMELPPYRMPTVGNLLTQMWTRAWLYLKKAGTVILGISIILWFLTSYPKPPAGIDTASPAVAPAGASEQLDTATRVERENRVQALAMSHSAAGRIGRFIEPALKPLGFDWRIGTALIGAFAAKEVFVAQMGIIFAVGEADEDSEALRSQLQRHYSPLVGFCIMLFALIATPCMATVTVTRQESGSWRWAFAQFWGLTALAWVVTFVVYQVGSRLVA